MKKSTLILIASLLVATVGFSQSNCSKFYPFSKGTTSQITTYDQKGKQAAIIDYTVTDVSKSNSTETATMNTKISDANGNILNDSTFSVSCSGEAISIDFKSLIGPGLLDRFKDLDYEISGNNIILPNNLSIGETLPDANMNVKINIAGMSMNIAVNMKDRKVIAEEKVTTPAGTFNCFVISYTSEIDSTMMSQSSNAKQWIAEGVGMVKQEDFDTNGKKSSSSILTAFSK